MKSVFLLGILAFTFSVPATVDISMSVHGICQDLSAFWLAGMVLISFFGMFFGVVLFAVYYRHYHSKDVKANVVYSTIFAAVITLVFSFVLSSVPL